MEKRMKQTNNIEIERKYISLFDLKDENIYDLRHFKTSRSHDRYYVAPSGLIRLRDDEEKGLEFTAKTYKKDNLHRREVNLNQNNNTLNDCLEFAEVAGWNLVLEFIQDLKIWITGDACISQTSIYTIDNKPYNFVRELDMITDKPGYPIAKFVEIEILDNTSLSEAKKKITRIQKELGFTNRDIVKYSLVQLFRAYPL